jgi:molybdate transport system substrate-binding protein
MRKVSGWLAWAPAVAILMVPHSTRAQSSDVLIFAAASLKNVIDDLAAPCKQVTGVGYQASYAASSTLAKQIAEGAPADIFISADLEWMDDVARRNLIESASRVNLICNDLVLVAPKASSVALKIAPNFGLAAALGNGRLAVGDPAAVPAGLYAKAALTSLGVWNSVSSRLAPSENVRAALLLVSRAEAPLGIVYRTDAIADATVRIVDVFPESSHPAIVYPAALTARAPAAARKVLEYLRGPAARAVFEKQGFRTNVPPVK